MSAPVVAWPKVLGVSRDANQSVVGRCSLSVAFAREVTDDEMRAFHDALRLIRINLAGVNVGSLDDEEVRFGDYWQSHWGGSGYASGSHE